MRIYFYKVKTFIIRISFNIIEKKKQFIGSQFYKFYENHYKRIQDFLCALSAIIVLSPLMGFVFLIVKIKLGTPVIFKQERTGKGGKPFTIYKFRTMTDGKDRNGNLFPDEKRLTTTGRLLRSTSVDELPELINIIKGDMAVVGPRPLLPEYLSLYTPFQKRRLEVRSGLTGYAQINGRNLLSWEEKFEKDVYYVEHISFWGDWKIIIKTFISVLKRKGISSDNSATMEKFTGNKHNR